MRSFSKPSVPPHFLPIATRGTVEFPFTFGVKCLVSRFRIGFSGQGVDHIESTVPCCVTILNIRWLLRSFLQIILRNPVPCSPASKRLVSRNSVCNNAIYTLGCGEMDRVVSGGTFPWSIESSPPIQSHPWPRPPRGQL
jgi:hypothetical protein